MRPTRPLPLRLSATAPADAPADAPAVRLGPHDDGSLAPVVAAVIERGATLRPGLVARLSAELELAFDEPYPPVRVRFAAGAVTVDDAPSLAPTIRIQGPLTDLVGLLTAPLGFAGIPSVRRSRGRRALIRIAFGTVRISGRPGQLRRLLAIVRI